jgi:hypothetical protein
MSRWSPGGPLFVVVSGPPASGKSTVAPAIAVELGLPLLAKDTIKDALMSVMPVPDVEASRQLGRAAVAAMLAVAAEAPGGAVIESNFYRSADTNTTSSPGRGAPAGVASCGNAGSLVDQHRCRTCGWCDARP